MKITNRQADGFARRPGDEIEAVLVFGPDAGLIAERVGALRRSVLGDTDDPFRSVDWSADSLLDDPARLADEVAALSLSGGRRVVVIRGAMDRHSEALAFLWKGKGSDTLVVIESGDLGPGSSLRRGFEAAAKAAALPCYTDGAEGLEALVRQVLAAAGLKADGRVVELISSRLGADRLANRSELDKLCLFKRSGTVTADDVDAILGDSVAASVDAVVGAAARGDQVELDAALQRCSVEGVAPVTLIRAMAKHLHRLDLAVAAVEGGASPQAAVDQLRPPVFFQRRAEFLAQVQIWSTARLRRAGELVTEAEISLKTAGMPAVAVTQRALMRLANAARNAARR